MLHFILFLLKSVYSISYLFDTESKLGLPFLIKRISLSCNLIFKLKIKNKKLKFNVIANQPILET